MCQRCGVSYTVDAMIIDANTTRVYCPNCLIFIVDTDAVRFKENILVRDDITGEPGAISYISSGETYNLNGDAFKRLVLHNLTPSEYKILYKKYVEPTGERRFMFLLHDDFYSDEGIAVQPIV